MKIALLFLTLSSAAAFAQPNTCGGLTSVTDGAQPVYPPIARAARVSGMVILLVSFKTTGEADTVQVVSGPPMLRQAAVDYVTKWKVNEYSGQRTCRVTITYTVPAGDFCRSSEPSFVRRMDPQHVIVHSGGEICQPNSSIP